MECLFCNIVNRKSPSYKVWEDENFFVFLDIMPINKGHILLVPKSHTEDVFDLSDNLFDKIFQVVRKLAGPLKQATSAKKIGLAIEGLGVSHVHIHIVPIHKGNDLNPERAKKASEMELKKIQKVLLNIFKNL
jgi:histidine triad (HIT) family protein